MDSTIYEIFERITQDDGLKLSPRGKAVIAQARRLDANGNTVDFLVQDVINTFGKVVRIDNPVSRNGKEWH